MTSTRQHLADTTLARLPGAVVVPAYDRADVQTGLVHLGIGAFHRAHQMVVTEAVLAAGDQRWGIVGASLRSPATRDALRAQDWLYSVVERDAEHESVQVIGALRGVLVAPERPAALVAALCDPRVKIVTLTVTEKGYCHAPATGDLDVANPEIRHDLMNPTVPKTALGFLVAALVKRRSAGIGPPTLVSCDNLFANGRTLKRLLVQFASESAPELARFIEAEVACPNTMVDRIVPATTDADRRHVSELLGLEDASPVVTEPFCQWVIEDHFPGGRPEWERGGAEFVDDVAPYELLKLRLLNASHSALAYLGAVAGHETVAEAMGDAGIACFVDALMRDEVAPVLSLPASFDIVAYRLALLARFRNPALRHRTHQIAMDGSQKLPPRILDTARERLVMDAPIDHLALVVAAWMRYVQGRDERGARHQARDPMAGELERRYATSGNDPDQLAAALLGIEAIFGRDLSSDPRFHRPVTRALRCLVERGVKATLAAWQ